jgi:glyoxylase-like metal-dependent hydrolase (beta-lactamase superfamily II)
MSTEESQLELPYIEVTNNVITTALHPYETDQLLRTHETGTMSCVSTESGLIFVDCGAIVKYAQKFRKDMEKRFDRPTTQLLLTHDHWHCTYGMAAFEDVDVVISSVGRSNFRKNFKNGVSDRWKERLLQGFPDDERLRESITENTLFVPNIGVPKEKTFGSKGNQILFHSCRGHSAAGAYVYVPSEKTLLTGGNLNTCYAQFVWPIQVVETYKEWESLDVEHVVPGHGRVVPLSYISLVREYFEQLLGKLRELKLEGLTAGQVLQRNDLPEYPHKGRSWIEGSVYHTQTVERLVKYWYGRVLKETRVEDDDLMFIS